MKSDDKNPESEGGENRPYFGTLKPLTAVQIISLIIPSSPVGAGACY